MVRRGMPDPFVEAVFARNEAVKKPWVKAETSSRIWVWRLPPTSGPGFIRYGSRCGTSMGARSKPSWPSK